MAHSQRLLSLLAVITALAGCCFCKKPPAVATAPSVTASTGTLKAGAAVVDITLGVHAPLAGYGGPPRREFTPLNVPLNLLALGGSCVDPNPATPEVLFKPSTGTLDKVWARALVLDNGTRKIAFVKLDTIGVTRTLRNDLVAAATPLGIADEDLVVLATHTHSGPGAVADRPLWQVTGADCMHGSVYGMVRSAAIVALAQADASRQAASLGIASTTVSGANKIRGTLPTLVDEELVLVKVVDSANQPIAALFNFAVHGTALGSNNMQLSPDCMGAMERRVETKLGGGVAIFTNGAEGDVVPAHSGPSGVEKEGDIIGAAVQTLWTGMSVSPNVKLDGALLQVDMPKATLNPFGCIELPGTAQTLCSALGILPTLPLDPSWVSTTLPFQAVRINDTVFIAMPGEPVTDIGRDLKQKAQARGYTRGVVLGLANEHGGYFSTVAQYQQPSYEGRSTLYGQGTGQFVINQADLVLGHVPP